MAGLPSGEFYLLSTSRDPDQFWIFCPPKNLARTSFGSFCPVQIFRGYLLDFLSAPNLSRISFGSFYPPKSFYDILDKMISLPNSAKPTFIYLSLSVGINLVLLLSSDPLTVIVGSSCLVLSLSSLASFYLDHIMLDQESI